MESREANVPKSGIEFKEVFHNSAARNETAFKPALPANVATGHHADSTVYNDEFGMHDAEWFDEDALHLHVEAW